MHAIPSIASKGILHDAIVVPTLQDDLASVRLLCDNGSRAYIQTGDGAVLISTCNGAPPTLDAVIQALDTAYQGINTIPLTLHEGLYHLPADAHALLTTTASSTIDVHAIHGHMPHDPSCPVCIGARMRGERHTRKAALPAFPTGLLDSTPIIFNVDLSGPYHKDIKGNRYGFHVGVITPSGRPLLVAGGIPNKQAPTCRDNLIAAWNYVTWLAGHKTILVRLHGDHGSEWRGECEEWAMRTGVRVTNTGGHNPQTNGGGEYFVCLSKDGARALLLMSCAGMRSYYLKLWSLAFRHHAFLFSSVQPDTKGVTPHMSLAGLETKPEYDLHPFGCKVFYHTQKHSRSDAFDAKARLGVWVGITHEVPGGHLVIPISWDIKTRSWELNKPIVSRRLNADHTVFPLRMGAPVDQPNASFDAFIELMHPFTMGEVPIGAAPGESLGTPPSSDEEQPEYEVECIIGKRFHGSPPTPEYHVKWVGYPESEATWEPRENLLNAQEAIMDFETDNVEGQVPQALVTTLAPPPPPAEAKVADIPCIDADWARVPHDVWLAAQYLQHKFKLTEVDPANIAKAYVKEFLHVHDMRFSRPQPKEMVTAMRTAVAVRMLCKVKKATHQQAPIAKCRLVLLGMLEPRAWDCGSVDSPVASLSTVRCLVFGWLNEDDTISSIDISVAFLQAHDDGPSAPRRYVKYRPYVGAEWEYYVLTGPIYGQRRAPRAWFFTLVQWLLEYGFVQGENDPCIFCMAGPEGVLVVLVYVDDLILRGPRCLHALFYKALHERFSAKNETYISEETPLTFIGLSIGMTSDDNGTSFSIDQEDDLLLFLTTRGIRAGRDIQSPMPNKLALTEDVEPVGEVEASTFRSDHGTVSFFACASRFDISGSVSRLGAMLRNPTKSAVTCMERLLFYLANTSKFVLHGSTAPPGLHNKLETWCDSDFAGDRLLTLRSQTSHIHLLNGAPAFWRSVKQSSYSTQHASIQTASGGAEIVAASDAVRAARLLSFRLTEMRMGVPMPLTIYVDANTAISFAEATCVDSALRGTLPLHDGWVRELRDKKVIKFAKVGTTNNLADLGSKCHQRGPFKRLVHMILNINAKHK